jgi:hypothetical protein
MVGNVHCVATGVVAKGFHSVRGHLSHHQPGESPRTISFVKKKARLDGAESKPYKCALSSQWHGEVLAKRE